MFLVSMATAHAEEIPTFKAKVGELKKITFKLAIPANTGQDFTYAVQIKDAQGFTHQLSWVQGTLHKGQEFSPQQSWVPDRPGEYVVEIFVFPCLSCPMALTHPLTMKVIVEA